MKSIHRQLDQARAAKESIQSLTLEERRAILLAVADELSAQKQRILEENKKDIEKMDIEDPRYDRLLFTEDRIEALAQSICDVSNLSDPTDVVLSSTILDNGLKIEKRTVALGVVGVIYESRPNVTVDVAALCIQSGNVCLLRGGTDAWHSNTFLVQLIQHVISKRGINPQIVQLLPTDREFVQDLLTATGFVDIIIPRGSQSLIDFVRTNAKVPVIETGAGVCHTYVDATADLDSAARIVANAKISRPSVCNALDTVLLDRSIAEEFVSKIIPYFEEAKVEVFASEDVYALFQSKGYAGVVMANESDFGREFLSLKCSIKTVSTLHEALQHIADYSSKHSECIVSTNAENIVRFMNNVDAAAVYSNASTRFTDGGEFGLGAEIGISTQKLHARGPFALEKLVTEKWFVTGDGQIR